jgi:hypothetical protein
MRRKNVQMCECRSAKGCANVRMCRFANDWLLKDVQMCEYADVQMIGCILFNQNIACQAHYALFRSELNVALTRRP